MTTTPAMSTSVINIVSVPALICAVQIRSMRHELDRRTRRAADEIVGKRHELRADRAPNGGHPQRGDRQGASSRPAQTPYPHTEHATATAIAAPAATASACFAETQDGLSAEMEAEARQRQAGIADAAQQHNVPLAAVGAYRELQRSLLRARGRRWPV